MKIKVKTIRLPITPNNLEELESEIENVVKNKVNDGWTLDKMVCDAAIVILLFTKQE